MNETVVIFIVKNEFSSSAVAFDKIDKIEYSIAFSLYLKYLVLNCFPNTN